jgi:hypothetical protein
MTIMTESEPCLFRLEKHFRPKRLCLKKDRTTGDVTNMGNVGAVPEAKPTRELKVDRADVVVIAASMRVAAVVVNRIW